MGEKLFGKRLKRFIQRWDECKAGGTWQIYLQSRSNRIQANVYRGKSKYPYIL